MSTLTSQCTRRLRRRVIEALGLKKIVFSMASLEEINFNLKVTKVHRKSIDRLVELADSDRKMNHQRLVKSMEGRDEDFDVEAFHSVFIDAPSISFSLYALAIIHCYSILENNRKLICLRIPGLTEGQKNNLHDVRVVEQCLTKAGFSHQNVRCYKTMNEFRLVNNAIKHDRYSLSKSITTENGKVYKAVKLRSLYSNRAKHLETYLSDLYRRV